MNTNEIQNVLWLQSASSLDADLFLINGEPPISKSKESETFLWMTSDWGTAASIKDRLHVKWRSPWGWKRHKAKYLQQGISNNLTFLENGDFLLIQACVLDTDEQGRKRPYIYCSSYPESKSITEILKNWAACIHSVMAHYNEEDMNCIGTFLRNRAKNKKKRIVSIAVALIVILIIAAAILYIINPDCFYSVYEKFRQTSCTRPV